MSGTRSRFLYKDYAKEICEIAVSEIFNKTVKESKNLKSDIFDLLKSSVGKSMTLNTDFTKTCSEKYLPDGYFTEVVGKIKVVDFNKFSPSGKLYDGRSEGHGIVAIEAKTLLYKSKGLQREFLASYYIEEHHDYIVSSAVCMGEHGSKLANSLVVRQNRELGEADAIKSDYVNSVLKIEKSPDGFHPVLPEKLTFYNETALWSKRNLTYRDLCAQNIINEHTHVVNLNGIIHCCEPITINNGWIVYGQGVIIAESFNINSGISKGEPDAICVLYARKGDFLINTNSTINAALISINNNYEGTLISMDTLHVNGAVVVDQIDISSWPDGDHSIGYDRNLKNDEKANRIAISNWINYRSIDDKYSENTI